MRIVIPEFMDGPAVAALGVAGITCESNARVSMMIAEKVVAALNAAASR